MIQLLKKILTPTFSQKSRILKPREAGLEENPKYKHLERFIVDYIDKTIRHDVEIGRLKENFHAIDYNAVLNNIAEFRNHGCRIFLGGGNVFILKITQNLNGISLVCMQIRGLAQRKIIIKEVN